MARPKEFIIYSLFSSVYQFLLLSIVIGSLSIIDTKHQLTLSLKYAFPDETVLF